MFQELYIKRRSKIFKDSGIPLYQQVSGKLARDISSGRLSPDSPLPSINSLEAKLGVARNTVIQAMRQLVHDGYAVAKHGKGFYAVNQDRKPVINIVVPLHHYYFIQIYVNLIAGVQELAEQKGERLQIYNTGETHAGFLSVLREITSYRPNARIIAVPPSDGNGGVNEKSCSELEKIVKTGARVVVVDRNLDVKGIPQVTQDKLEGRKLLLSEVFRKPCASALFFDADEHAGALREFSASSGWHGRLTFEKSSGLMNDLDRISQERYEAVFCTNDLHARRLLNAAGGKIGCMIAGYDGTMSAISFSPRISTVSSNLMKAGEKAYNLLSGNLVEEKSNYVKPFFVGGDTL